MAFNSSYNTNNNLSLLFHFLYHSLPHSNTTTTLKQKHTNIFVFEVKPKENTEQRAGAKHDFEADIQRVLLLATAVQAGAGGGAVGNQDPIQ